MERIWMLKFSLINNNLISLIHHKIYLETFLKYSVDIEKLIGVFCLFRLLLHKLKRQSIFNSNG